MILYGWEEQNEAQFGVVAIALDIDLALDGVTADEDGLLTRDGVLPVGCWYATFWQAVRAAKIYWRHELAVSRKAIAMITKQKVSACFN